MIDSNLRARSTSEIVDAAFALYRRHFVQYLMITAIAYSPVLILSLLSRNALQPQTGRDLLGLLPVYLVSFLTMSLVSGVVVRMGSDVYLGSEPDVARTLRQVLPRVPALLLATLLNIVLLLVAFLFFIIPSLYVFVRNFAVWPAVVLEGVGPFAAFGRSGKITRGRKGHIFWTLVLVYGIFMILSFGLLLLAGMSGSTVLTLVVSSVYSVFAYPVVNLVTMVLYYDCRIRNEGFDVEHMTQSLGAQEPLAAF